MPVNASPFLFSNFILALYSLSKMSEKSISNKLLCLVMTMSILIASSLMLQINQTQEVLVTPAFFNYQILKSIHLEKPTLFNVIKDRECFEFGGNTASIVNFDALLVHKSFEQFVRGERLPLC